MNKSNIYGFLGTVLINGIVLLLLMYFTLSGAKEIIKPQEEFVEVMFGDGAGGAGALNPGGSISEPSPSSPTAQPTQSTNSPNTPTEEENVMSQMDESEVAVPDKPVVKKKEEVKKPQTVEDKLQQLQELREKEAIRQQKIADAKAAQLAAERQAIANKVKGSMTAFGRGTGGGVGNGEGTGSGSGGGRGTGGDGFGNGNGDGGSGASPGNPLGRGAGGGNSWSLAGRSMNGALTKPPYVGNSEGKIIVQITVDKNGNVIGTVIDRNTTISDENQRAACKAAARKQKFSADAKASGNVVGTITYNFKFEN